MMVSILGPFIGKSTFMATPTARPQAPQPTVEETVITTETTPITQALQNHLIFSTGKTGTSVTMRDWYSATALTVRDHVIERWVTTRNFYRETDPKRVFYLSLEFLIGRMMSNAALNIGIEPKIRDGLHSLGQQLENVAEMEHDAALGNGGLGRLAACFLDSMATLDMPGTGYGIRYEYGMFRQTIENGQQVEHPDNWLRYGNVWEFQRPELTYTVKFYGRVVEFCPVEAEAANGKKRSGASKNLECHWVDTETVLATAYDVPIPGYSTETVNNLRLWSAKATREFDLAHFNEGNYERAVEDRTLSENISKVLYPNDTSVLGRELRLKQQYFFVSASIQDILRCYSERKHGWEMLPDKIAIQLNDTHPAVAVAEMMYQLVDERGLTWDRAWRLTTRIFSYTNHTLMPEALETWPVDMFGKLLPRHLKIIYRINHEFLQMVNHKFPGDTDLLRRVSIIDEEHGRRVRMAYLAVIGSHKVNGVAALHSDLLKTTLFADFARIFPEKFINVTNGITPRRWLNQCNRSLTKLIADTIGSSFQKNLDKLAKLAPYAEDANFRKAFREVKQANKQRLADRIEELTGVKLNTNSMFDVQIKRIHEYKRQLLNLMHVITLYNRIRAGQADDITPRVVIFGGKAAPGYWMAKLIIRLINDVAAIVNEDLAVGDKLKVVFYPNYEVSAAELLFPGSDLSEQISTAGTEASGTGNMKMALNGALTIGTLDGANIEIREEVGEENIFIFGLTTQEVAAKKAAGYNPWDYYHANAELRQVLDMIGNGYFNVDEPGRYKPIFDTLLNKGDYYMLLADYEGYVACQEAVGRLYQDQEEWSRRAILNVARIGKFSSDRTIREYAEKIWKIAPVER
jgi:glycogen phosphorylase